MWTHHSCASIIRGSHNLAHNWKHYMLIVSCFGQLSLSRLSLTRVVFELITNNPIHSIQAYMIKIDFDYFFLLDFDNKKNHAFFFP